MGYSKGRRHKEFQEFLADGKQRVFGALVMEHDTVYSYGLLIARIDRAARVVATNREKRSKTTTQHQNALLIPEGWTEVSL